MWSKRGLRFAASYLLARPMVSGFGGGISRHTEGISMSRPPGPVTSHLLRWELSFRMPSFPFKIPFCGAKTWHQRKHPQYSTFLQCVSVCQREFPTCSCLKSHKACTMTGLLLFSSGLRGFSLTMVFDLLTRLWTCLLLSMMRSLSFCDRAEKERKKKKNLSLRLRLFATHRSKTLHQPQAFHRVVLQTGLVSCQTYKLYTSHTNCFLGIEVMFSVWFVVCRWED